MPVHAPVLRSRRAIRRAALLGLPAILAVLATCTEAPTSTATTEPERPVPGPGESTAAATALSGSIPLPIFQSVTTTGTAFGIVQSGTGHNGYFLINNSASDHTALQGITTGIGRAANFAISNANSAATALQGTTNGRGAAIQATANGRGIVGYFESTLATSLAPAVRIRSAAKGAGMRVDLGNTSNVASAVEAWTNGVGTAGYFRVNNAASPSPVVQAITEGPGTGLAVSHLGPPCTSTPTACNLAVFQNGSTNQIRFGRLGRGYFNGGTQTGGADVAEAFRVEGRPSDYEPGDVLVISTRSDQRVERSREPYSTLVAGVYATKPGVLLTERHIDASLDDTVPLGVIGVIPTKVSAENGAIRRGDLLVTARTPGHAMRADPERLRVGTSLGKALEVFTGAGTGVIRVLVSVK